MIRPGRRLRRTGVWLTAMVGLGLLWILTAGEDVPGALWRTYNTTTTLRNLLGSAAIIGAAYVCSSGSDMPRRFLRATLVAGGIGVPLAALELPAIVLGHDYGVTLGTRPNDTWLQLAMGVNGRDEELLHIHKPHTRYSGAVVGNLTWLGLPARPPYNVDVAYDRNGFRNSEDFTHADVVAIGDSFVEGAEVGRDLTVVARIGQALNVPAANLGQSNYGPQQELVVLKRYGVALSPKIVVWFLFGGNDLGDVDAYEWRRQHLDEFLRPPVVSLSARTFTRNAVIAVAKLTTPPRRVESPVARRHHIDFTSRSGAVETLYLDAEEGPWLPRQWDVASETLLGAREVTRRAGADLLVVYVPRKLRVYSGFIRAEPGTFAHTWRTNNLPDVLGAWCDENGIPFLDSTVPLRDAVASGRSVYLPDDVHWSPEGHEVVGAAVSERIRVLGSLRASHGGTGS